MPMKSHTPTARSQTPYATRASVRPLSTWTMEVRLCPLRLLLDPLRRFSQLAHSPYSLSPGSPPYKEQYGASHVPARGCVYSPCLSFSLTLRLASPSAASAAACAASRGCRRASYSGSVSQWVASPFKAASSPTRPDRSRAVSLATSFGSCGPIYGSLILCLETVE